MKRFFSLLTVPLLTANLGLAHYSDPLNFEVQAPDDYPKYLSLREHPSHAEGSITTYTGFTCDDTSWSAKGAEFLITEKAEYYVSVIPGVMFGSRRACKILSEQPSENGIKVKIRGDEDCSLTVIYPRNNSLGQNPNTVVYVFTKSEC